MYNQTTVPRTKKGKSSKNPLKTNDSQKTAITHKSGSLLVIAGAGTGKTRVITERIRNLIEHENVRPEEILALTFTEKAANEMLERIGDVMPLGYEEPWVYTFHSFADRILRSEGLEIGLDPSYKIISTPDQWLLVRKNLFKFDLKYFRPLGNPTKFIAAILKFISRIQDENISVESFSKYSQEFADVDEEKTRWLELAKFYQKYQELKIANSKMDFGDLIVWAIKLFKERPALLKKYQKQFKHILVDEFQDTNHAQYELVKLLYPNGGDKAEIVQVETLGRTPEKVQENLPGNLRSLLVVGDDSQSIYKFRGAAVSNILEFMRDYPNAQMVTLLRNYRSTQKILDPAYKLIKNNNPDTLESKLGISKELVSEISKSGVAINIFQTENGENEVDFVISKILGILATEPQYTYKDFAILARANNHLDAFVLALRKRGLPYQLVGNRGLYDRDEVRDVLALLKVIVNPLDGIALYRALNIKTLNIPYTAVTQMLSQSRYKKVDLWELVKLSNDENVQSFYKTIIEYQENITKATPVEIVYNLVSAIKYVSQFLEEDAEALVENQLSIKNLDLFLNKVKGFEVEFRSETKETPTIIDFVDFIELMVEAGENPAQAEIEDIDTINLLTVHASKGLEFPVVFMINLVGDRFPTREKGDPIPLPEALIKESLPVGDEHIQEERRLFYVGMTRAQKYLFLTLAKNYGGKREKVPSGFVEETGLKINFVPASEIKTEGAGSLGGAEEETQETLFGVGTPFREPEAHKIKEFVPDFLSYSQIETYLTCPLQYKYAYVLKIPTPPSHALSFGNSIHDTLRDYHNRLMFGENVTLDQLLEIYKNSWQPLGYLNEEHRQMRFREGEELLRKYYEENKHRKFKHKGLEKTFNMKIDGIKFYGKIDRIDELADGGVEIIDYKTGQTKNQKDVDKDSQVAFYAIAAKEVFGLNVEKLSYYFVDSGEKISTTRTPKQLEEKKKEVTEVIGRMKSGNFEATPGMHCLWCDYKEICPYAYRG